MHSGPVEDVRRPRDLPPRETHNPARTPIGYGFCSVPAVESHRYLDSPLREIRIPTHSCGTPTAGILEALCVLHNLPTWRYRKRGGLTSHQLRHRPQRRLAVYGSPARYVVSAGAGWRPPLRIGVRRYPGGTGVNCRKAGRPGPPPHIGQKLPLKGAA
jgi:hypothetical protein